jgi:tRNA-specific 2-thiouridylase
MNKTVVVGMSGGVDSSVAAYLLKQEGYRVIGVTMQIWQEDSDAAGDGGCCGLSAVEDARRVAEVLDIPYYVMNFRDVFQRNVIDYFAEEYLHGRTPNPCIACNRYVKWEALLHRSMEIGADAIATGHYAKVKKLPNGRFTLAISDAVGKDQTYALYNLTQFQLSRTLMPVGNYDKTAIRAMAKEAGLPVAHKRDSQEICFVQDGDYAAFLERERKGNVPAPGNFVDREGNILGRHKGITHYTVGQRKGLGLAFGYPVYVSQIRSLSNEVVIGGLEDIETKEVQCHQVNWMAYEDITEPKRVFAKIRYNHRGETGTVMKQEDGTVLCIFDKPVRGAAPGQAIVFYEEDYVLGGGTILPPVKR